MPVGRDYLIPKGYRDEQLLELLKRIDGEFRFSKAERSQLPMHLVLLVGMPALAMYFYFFGHAEFPPVDRHDWVTLSMIPLGVFGSLFIRLRRLDNLRFEGGILSFVDASGAIRRSVSVSNIERVRILSREKVGKVRIRTATEKFDFYVPDELLVAIRRDADDPFDTTRF